MKRFGLILTILLLSCSMAFAATSVEEQVGTSQDEAAGTVATIGLSNYDGVHFALSGGTYAAAQPGAKAVAVGSGSGCTIGYGARLQYTLYGNTGTFKVSALCDETGNGCILVGITELSDIPIDGERTSRSVGSINDVTANTNDHNGLNGMEVDYTSLDDDPAMFRLSHVTARTLLQGIGGEDTWTGTTSDDGAQLYYNLLANLSTVVTYTLTAES